MELTSLHLYMEVFAAACLIFIGGMNIIQKATGKYSTLVASGCIIAGIAELAHGVIPHMYPVVLHMDWMAISGGMSRLTLTIMLFLLLACYDKVNCAIKPIMAGMSIPIIISIAPLLYPIDLSWTYTQFEFLFFTITRPIDAFLLCLWICLTVLLRHKSHVIFPPNTFWIFMTQGIMIHVLMAFSVHNDFDNIVFLAHAIKISEYYSFILIYLLYKFNYDHIKSCNNIPNLINTNAKMHH